MRGGYYRVVVVSYKDGFSAAIEISLRYFVICHHPAALSSALLALALRECLARLDSAALEVFY